MSAARQYFQRSPRYVLTATDQNSMRFASMRVRKQAVTTRLHDLSETGLAFVLERPEGPYPDLPDEGDMIKIEFTIPGRKQIACFATIVRVEERSEWSPEFGDQPYVVVAVQFRNLPTLHRRSIEVGLRGRVTPEEEAVSRFTWTDDFWRGDRRAHLFAFTGVSLALVFSFWFAVQPPTAWLSSLHRFFHF